MPFRRRYHAPIASPLAERLTCPSCHRPTVEVGWLALVLRCRPCGITWHGVAAYEAELDAAREIARSGVRSPAGGGVA